VVTANREASSIAAKEEDLQVGPGQTDTRGKRDGPAVDEVSAVSINEIGKARGAANAGKGNDFLVLDLAFLEDFVIAGENGEIAAAGAPRRVIGGDSFLGQFLARRRGFGGR
jgi:hypothetical protein